jgi:RNA polymerase primary sigma factor
MPVEAIEALAESDDLEVDEADEADEEEDDGGAGAQSASLMQLKADALERFTTIRGLYDKMAVALQKKGYAATRPT